MSYKNNQNIFYYTFCGVIREVMMDELKRRVEGQEAEIPGILNTP